MTNGRNSKMSISFIRVREKRLLVLTKIGKNFSGNLLTTIWPDNHPDYGHKTTKCVSISLLSHDFPRPKMADVSASPRSPGQVVFDVVAEKIKFPTK